MRTFIAFLAHETNSFSSIETDLNSFEEIGVYRPSMGDPSQHLPLLKGAGDFYQTAIKRGHQAIVGTCALAQPSAPCKKQDYEALRNQILKQLSDADTIDSVLIMMHGSMMAEEYDDCEGDMIKRMRKIVGPNVPIGLLLDLHCNVTKDMLDNTTFIVPCKEYPHTDFAERANELYTLVESHHKGHTKPKHSFFKVPVLGLFQTIQSPMKDFVNKMKQIEKQEGVLSVGLAHGFPWADFPDAGAGVIVTTNDMKVRGDEIAAQLGREFFEIREQAQAKTELIEEIIPALKNTSEGTIVIADMADNPGGGAASDSTFILAALLEAEIKDALLGLFWDPENLDKAFSVGEGKHFILNLGGKHGTFSGPELTLDAQVKCLSHNANQPHIADGYNVELGRTAVIETNGITLVFNDIRQQPFHPQAFNTAGIDPWKMKIVVVKSSYHFYTGFSPQASKVYYIDSLGLLNNYPNTRPYQRITRPIWPLDDIQQV